MPTQIKTIADLQPDKLNANKGSVRGSGMLEKSLRNYGAGRSILVDRDGSVIAGNKTLEGAAAIGLDDVIVVQSDGTKLVVVQRTDLDINDPKARQLAIADNRVGQVSLEWDSAVLSELLADGVDLTEFWHGDELAELLGNNEELGGLLDEVDPDAIPENVETRCKPGDLWQLGRHRLLCGDSTSIDNVERLLDGNKADCMLTDPPYGLGDTDSVKNNYDVYLDTSDNLTQLIADIIPIGQIYAERIVLTPGIGNMWLYPKPTWCMAWFTPAGVGSSSWGFCCWQPILCYGKDPRLQNREGRYPDALVHTESSEKLGHPCSKPVKFWTWLLERSTAGGGSIFEPFAGSGTGFIAAEELGRVCYGIELSPKYCDIILARWEAATGKTAELVITNV